MSNSVLCPKEVKSLLLYTQSIMPNRVDGLPFILTLGQDWQSLDLMTVIL